MNHAKSYYSQVKRRIPVNGKRRRELLQSIKAEIEEYASSAPSATVCDYYERFGKPDEIAVSFVSEMPYSEIDARLRGGRRALRIACITAAVISTVAAVSLAISIHYIKAANDDFHNGYIIMESEE